MSVDVANPSSSDHAVIDSKPRMSDLLAHFGSQELIDARRLLADRPEYADHRSMVIDVAYEEYCRRKDAGESIDHQAFAGRFPNIEQSLLCLLDIDDCIANDPDSLLSNLWPKVGSEILGFSLVEEIGRGGFSRVFLARQADLGDRVVVVKICGQPNDEAARLGPLTHRNIVRVYSVQTQPETGLTAICMPYLGCATLDDVIRAAFKGRPPSRGAVVLDAANAAATAATDLDHTKKIHWTLRSGSYAEAIIEIAAQLCNALAYAHEKGIYHCDVKPSNVLVTANGQSKLFDFNLSLQQGGGAATVGGTLPYMAPEQLRYMIAGRAEDVPQIDGRTDIFSLGVSIFQVLTGSLPFAVDESGKAARKSAAQNLLEQQRTQAFPAQNLEKVVGRRAARTIASCLAFDPEDRPKSPEVLARQLRGYLSPVQRALRQIRSHPRIVAATSFTIMMILAGFVAYATYMAMRPEFLCQRGLELEKEGRDAEAASYYHEAQESNQDLSVPRDGLCRLGIKAIGNGEFDLARSYLDEALKYEPEFGPALLARGWADLHAAQEARVASEEGQELLTSAFNRLDFAHQVLGSGESAVSLFYCYSLLGKPRDAIKLYEEEIEAEFRSGAVLNNYGYNLCVIKGGARYEDAISPLLEAIDSVPNQRRPNYNLAIVKNELARLQIESSKLKDNTEVNRAKAVDRLKGAQSEIGEAVTCIEAARPLATREMEYVAAKVYANAILVAHQVPDSDQVERRMEEYSEALLTSCERAVDLGLHPKALKDNVVTWLTEGAAFSEKEETLADFVSELQQKHRFPSLEGEGDLPNVKAPSEERLFNLSDEILPRLLELLSPPRP